MYVMKSPAPYWPPVLCRMANQRITPTAIETMIWLIGVPSAAAAACLAVARRSRSAAARRRSLS